MSEHTQMDFVIFKFKDATGKITQAAPISRNALIGTYFEAAAHFKNGTEAQEVLLDNIEYDPMHAITVLAFLQLKYTMETVPRKLTRYFCVSKSYLHFTREERAFRVLRNAMRRWALLRIRNVKDYPFLKLGKRHSSKYDKVSAVTVIASDLSKIPIECGDALIRIAWDCSDGAKLMWKNIVLVENFTGELYRPLWLPLISLDVYIKFDSKKPRYISICYQYAIQSLRRIAIAYSAGNPIYWQPTKNAEDTIVIQNGTVRKLVT